MESGTLTGSSCEPHFYIPIPLNAANTPLYGSCKLETRSVSSVVVRNTSIKQVYNLQSTQVVVHWRYVTHNTLKQTTLLIGSKHITHRLEISFRYAKHYRDVFRLMSTLQVTCVNDRVTCLQHVTHRLEISFGYAKHYLDL